VPQAFRLRGPPEALETLFGFGSVWGGSLLSAGLHSLSGIRPLELTGITFSHLSPRRAEGADLPFQFGALPLDYWSVNGLPIHDQIPCVQRRRSLQGSGHPGGKSCPKTGSSAPRMFIEPARVKCQSTKLSETRSGRDRMGKPVGYFGMGAGNCALYMYPFPGGQPRLIQNAITEAVLITHYIYGLTEMWCDTCQPKRTIPISDPFLSVVYLFEIKGRC
jgi:hypothetical protein